MDDRGRRAGRAGVAGIARLGDDIGPYLGDAPEDRLSVRRMAWNLVAAYAPQTEAEKKAAENRAAV